ncbi:hypothetical protein N7526_000938 [Penicillium atrosanguineum]|nr:hypothetical protein N7526_000938 [Penicillium atrosanguineum]
MTLTAFHDTGWVSQSLPQVSAHASPVQKKGRRQTGTPWTRSGCLTCKKRRKGCDKAKPSCNNCLKQGRKCEGYGDLWVEPLGPSAQVFVQADAPKLPRLTAHSPPRSLSPSPSVSPFSYAWNDSQLSPVSLDWSTPSSPQRIIDIEAEETTQNQDEKHSNRAQCSNYLSSHYATSRSMDPNSSPISKAMTIHSGLC